MREVQVSGRERQGADAFHRLLYDGEILCFRSMPEMVEIVEQTREHLQAQFHPHDPRQIHLHLEHDVLVDRCAAARREYMRSPIIVRAWQSLFGALGMKPADYGLDRLVIRFHIPESARGDQPAPPGTAMVPFHRDTWGSNLYAQINWWAPVYELAPDRTFAMYPHLWSTPLPNSSADFDIDRTITKRRQGQASRKDMVPQLTDLSLATDPHPVLIAPGEVIAFSSQHAHGGLPNTTDQTRISLETRSICIAHENSGFGAPNVDGQAPQRAPRLFKRMSDGVSLTALLTE